MSGHFVYEIDERKLRVRLQEFEVETSPDSWTNFEAYYHQAHQQNKDGHGLKVQVPISMNVVLPIIFGAVIIIIAVVLFQFINIKNPPPANTETVQSPPTLQDTSPKPVQTQKSITAIDSSKAARIVTITTTTADSTSSANAQAKTQAAPAPSIANNATNTIGTDSGKTTKVEEKPRIKESALFTPKETPKNKKKKKKNNNDSAAQEKTIEEVPGNGADDVEATMKPNAP